MHHHKTKTIIDHHCFFSLRLLLMPLTFLLSYSTLPVYDTAVYSTVLQHSLQHTLQEGDDIAIQPCVLSLPQQAPHSIRKDGCI
jgi:hypothetical protein